MGGTPALRRDAARYLPLLPLLLALGLRLYRIDSPLWLDEVYGYRLARLDVAAIVRQSLSDPHPPLYYLIQWALSAGGRVQSSFGWRWLPLACSLAAGALSWRLAAPATDRLSRTLMGLLMATSPVLLFYSQEARAYALLMLLAAGTAALVAALYRDGGRGRLWAAWALLSLAGVYAGYGYSMLIGAQLAVLGWRHWRRPALWLSAAGVALGALPLLPLARGGLGRVAAEHSQAQQLSLWRIAQTISAGEIDRYPAPLIYTAIPALFLALGALGLLRAIRLRDPALLAVAAQLLLPLGAFAAASWALDLRLPQAQAKQFALLLPLWFVLLAGGLAELRRLRHPRLGALAALFLFGALATLSGVGVGAYWAYPKSPEGEVVRALRGLIQPGERVVSLHYAPVFTVALELPEAPLYLNPTPSGAAYAYWLMRADTLFTPSPAPEAYASTDEIRRLGGFWLISHLYRLREPIASLTEGCATTRRAVVETPSNAFELIYVVCPTARRAAHG